MMTKLVVKVTRTNPGCDKAVRGAVAGPPGRVYLHMHVMLCFTVLGLVPVSDNGSPLGAYIPVIILNKPQTAECHRSQLCYGRSQLKPTGPLRGRMTMSKMMLMTIR